MPIALHSLVWSSLSPGESQIREKAEKEGLVSLPLTGGKTEWKQRRRGPVSLGFWKEGCARLYCQAPITEGMKRGQF